MCHTRKLPMTTLSSHISCAGTVCGVAPETRPAVLPIQFRLLAQELVRTGLAHRTTCEYECENDNKLDSNPRNWVRCRVPQDKDPLTLHTERIGDTGGAGQTSPNKGQHAYG